MIIVILAIRTQEIYIKKKKENAMCCRKLCTHTKTPQCLKKSLKKLFLEQYTHRSSRETSARYYTGTFLCYLVVNRF